VTAISNMVGTALLNVLSANANLVALVGTRMWDTQAAAGQIANDYLVFHDAGSLDDNVNPRRSLDLHYVIEVFSKVHANAEAGQGYIDDALNGTTLPIAGWTCYGLTMDRPFSMVDDVLGIPWYRKGGQYRIRLDNE
jgi:hypothetical protein